MSQQAKPPNSEEMTSRIDRSLELLRLRRHNAGRAHASSTVGKAQRDLSMLHVFVWQVIRSYWWIYRNILGPTWSWLMGNVVRPLWRTYRRLWQRMTTVKNQYGDEEFSKIRGGVMILATAGFFYIFYNVLDFTADVGLYAVTAKHDEDMFLLKSQEINPTANIFNVTGCHAIPCSDQNSIYFRAQPGPFNHVWAILNTGYPFFPDFVAAAIPPGVSACKVTSYGIRLKLIMRGFDMYPDILAATCTPINPAGRIQKS